jgi:HK97 gp10 family phage protein
MAIQVKGFDKMLDKLENIKNVEKKLAPVIRKTTLKVEAQAKREAPVDTGDLRNSIDSKFQAKGNVLVARIRANAKYAEYVHEGTGIFKGGMDSPSTGRIRAGTTNSGSGGIRPNRFMTRAEKWAKENDVFREALNQEISKLLR